MPLWLPVKVARLVTATSRLLVMKRLQFESMRLLHLLNVACSRIPVVVKEPTLLMAVVRSYPRKFLRLNVALSDWSPVPQWTSCPCEITWLEPLKNLIATLAWLIRMFSSVNEAQRHV